MRLRGREGTDAEGAVLLCDGWNMVRLEEMNQQMIAFSPHCEFLSILLIRLYTLHSQIGFSQQLKST